MKRKEKVEEWKKCGTGKEEAEREEKSLSWK